MAVERDTFERALHMWPEWTASLEKSRLDLGYDLAAPIESRIDWIEANYPDIRAKAQSELDRLQLPPNLFQYWEDCLYCDYLDAKGRVHFDRITRNSGYLNLETGEFTLGNKSLPPLPFEQEIVWYDDEDINRPWVRLEIKVHPSFFTHEMLNEAAEDGYRSMAHIVHYHGYQEHPVLKIINRSKVKPNPRKKEAIRRSRANEIDFEGLLAEEWRTEDTQQKLGECRAEYQIQPMMLANAEKALKNRVYNRIKTWFTTQGLAVPRLKHKGRWWRE